MAKKRETTAIVFVEQNWYAATLRLLIGKPKSTSTNGTHILIGELRDSANDPHGIWFRDVPSPHVRDDRIVKIVSER